MIQTASYEELSRRAAQLVAAQVVLKPDSVLGLATGSTPEGTYRRLVELHRAGELDFSRVSTVNLDEYVGLDRNDAQSYHYYMRTHLFSHINLLPENTHLPDGMAADTAGECACYDRLMDRLGAVDLQLLGIGHNGHIGFNEPGGAFVPDTHCVTLSERTVEANRRFFPSEDQVPRRALTMGVGRILRARRILLLVSGADKREALRAALYGPITPQLPASILQLHPDVTVVAHDQPGIEAPHHMER